MAHKHASHLAGAVAAGIAATCSACSTLPEEAFDPDDEMRQEILDEIEEAGSNIEIVEMMIDAADALPNNDGDADSDNSDVIQEIREGHKHLVDVFEDDRIKVIWQGDYTGDPGVRGIYVYGTDPGEGDDNIVAFLCDETGELMTSSSDFEHESAHRFGYHTDHSDEVRESNNQDLTSEELTDLYLENGDSAYIVSELFDLPRVLEMYMELMEIDPVRDYHENAHDEFILEFGQEIYLELSKMKEMPREQWVKKLLAGFTSMKTLTIQVVHMSAKTTRGPEVVPLP
jgi:hypothetical protein